MPVPASDRGGEGFLTHAAEAELRAEVDRLREALAKISVADPADAEYLRRVARAALDGGK